MRRRFWIPTALLALGLVFYFAVYGFRFAGVLLFLAAGVVLAFGIVDALRGRFPRFSRWATRLGLILVCLGLLLAAGTAGWVVSAGRGAADPEAQWVVVLGAGVNGTVPSQALRERLEAAQDYLARYPEAVAVLSGAQGDGEAITEAQCMYDWLTARGVDPARLRRSGSWCSGRFRSRPPADGDEGHHDGGKPPLLARPHRGRDRHAPRADCRCLRGIPPAARRASGPQGRD